MVRSFHGTIAWPYAAGLAAPAGFIDLVLPAEHWRQIWSTNRWGG